MDRKPITIRVDEISEVDMILPEIVMGINHDTFVFPTRTEIIQTSNLHRKASKYQER